VESPKWMCVLQSGAKGVFIVSQEQFPDLVEEFAWKCMAGRPPHGGPARNFGQTDLVKLVPHCRLLSNVATKWPSRSVDTHGGT
jgi:hypothetical protein